MTRTADPRTRPALLEAARDLFYSGGVGLTALDDIAAASGLTKPTLYRHFPSKEALIAAYLDDRHEQLDLELRTWIQAAPPRQRPRAVIDWLCNWISRPGFNGCAFVRAYAELPGDMKIRAKVRKRKRIVLQAIVEACRTAGVPAPEMLAGQLALIVEGATTMVFVSGDSKAVTEAARGLAETALAAAGLADTNG